LAALCPQCGTSLDQDFGVVSCPHCHAVLAIDIDGQVEIQNQNEIAPEEIRDPVFTENPVEEFVSVVPPETDTFQVQDNFIPDPPQALENNSTSVISYHVTIEGIDTKELRKLLEEALSDEKFPWTAREIVQQTNGGVLELGPMNPVAASVLVRKLKDLSLSINWRQSIYE
jgi:uncharacterized Zn finger protein (UPF0148 family)